MSKHISYSSLKTWNECPFKYKLVYVDGLGKYTGSEYTAFGVALHEACEKKLLNNSEDEVKIFTESFEDEIKKLTSQKTPDEKLITEMREQGKTLAKLVLPAVLKQFGNFTVLAAEEDIYLKIADFADWNFKGFIDLIIKTEDGKIHILDWKSCAWGWDAKKKSDAITTYQLTLYKHFYCLKHNIETSMVETHFALLKRTAKEDNVEIFRVTSGDKKTENALNLMKKALYSIDKSFFPKNRLSCKNCEFNNTKECPK